MWVQTQEELVTWVTNTIMPQHCLVSQLGACTGFGTEKQKMEYDSEKRADMDGFDFQIAP